MKKNYFKRKFNQCNQPPTSLANAKIQLINSPDCPLTVSNCISKLSIRSLEELHTWIINNPQLSERTFSNPYPNTINEFRKILIPRKRTLDRELAWFGIYILPFLSEISGFLQSSRQFEENYLLENNLECMKILDSIEIKFGYSFWLLKKKIPVIQNLNGLESQKKYVQELKNTNKDISVLVKYILHNVSYKSEPSVTLSHFEKTYVEGLRGLGLGCDLDSFLKYHIIQSFVDIESIAYLLAAESVGSVIDYYEAFIHAAQIIVINQRKEYYQQLMDILHMLEKYGSDIRVKRILINLRMMLEPAAKVEIANMDSARLFFQGQYSSSFEKSISILKEDLLNPGELYLACLCAACSVEGAEYPTHAEDSVAKFIDTVRSLIVSDENFMRARDYIWRCSGVVSDGIMFPLLRCLLSRELTTNPLSNTYSDYLFYYSGVNSIHPIQLWHMSATTEDTYFAPYFDSTQTLIKSPTLGVLSDLMLQLGEDHLSPNELNWLGVRLAFFDGDYEAALGYSEKMAGNNMPYFHKNGVRSVAHCLIELQRYEECIDFVVKLCLADRNIINILPVKEIKKRVERSGIRSLNQRLSYVIFVDLCVSYIDTHSINLRSYACEDFLIAHKLRKPSDIVHITKNFKSDELRYFLDNICVEQVLDGWTEFSSSNEVFRERVSICQILIDLDKNNKEKYQAEIKNIMMRLTIKERLREIEQSKVYIDTDSVKKVACQNLIEQYSRYLSFMRSGLLDDELSILNDAKQKMLGGDIETLLSTTIPRNEVYALFEYMISYIRNEFVSSSRHGLDGYLSVRIRHGTLATQLRSPLEVEHLLTLKNSDTDKYNENEYWAQRLNVISDVAYYKVQEAFKEFSKGVDDLINLIINEWIQIRKTEEGKGLFDFRLLSPEVNVLMTLVDRNTSLNEFVDIVVDYFLNNRITPSLESIRGKLERVAKPKLNNLLTGLQTAIEELGSVQGITDLRRAINSSRTIVQNTFIRIINWFYPSSLPADDPFCIEEIVKISEASIRTAYPDFEVALNVSSDMEEFRIKGSLASFVDILFLAFENLAKHAHIRPIPKAEINVTLEEQYIRIFIENNIGPNVKNATNVQRIAKIKEAVRKQPFSQSVRKEGGSGFHKIQKILHHDFNLQNKKIKPTLDFGFAKNNKFYVELHIPVEIRGDDEFDIDSRG